MDYISAQAGTRLEMHEEKNYGNFQTSNTSKKSKNFRIRIWIRNKFWKKL